MGSRPDLLERSLESLSEIVASCKVLAVNDFGDVETNQVFQRMCPHGEIIDLGAKAGHHRAADALYERVDTEFVFHMEDDWLFSCQDFISQALKTLQDRPKTSMVCFRAVQDFDHSAEVLESLEAEALAQHPDFFDLSHMHEDWHGYTFNPHIARLDLWKEFGGFSQFTKERYVSRAVRQLGYTVAYERPGSCVHIGDGRTLTTPTLGSRLKELRTYIRGVLGISK